MTDGDTWNAEDSRIYAEIARIAVPHRAEQIATVLTLIPHGRDDSFRVVELGSGRGAMTASFLSLFPAATVLALDGAPEMRDATRIACEEHAPRLETRPFRLEGDEWRSSLRDADVVVSSLCIHHLDDAGKQQLFTDVGAALAPGGVLLIADLVAPVHPAPHQLFAQTWDARTEAESIAIGDPSGYRQFRETQWNLYRFPDPVDRPSPLFAQLRWLADAGFEAVDVFWMDAGHAIYGGFRGSSARPADEDRYPSAIESARAALARETSA